MSAFAEVKTGDQMVLTVNGRVAAKLVAPCDGPVLIHSPKAMDPDLEKVISSFQTVWLGLLCAGPRDPDMMNRAIAQDRLAMGEQVLREMEKKYNLPHFEYLDHKY